MFKYFALLLSYRLLSWLPTGAAYFIADGVGASMYYLRPGLRKSVQSNMRHVMGSDVSDADIRATSRRVMRNAARYYADLVRSPRQDMKRFLEERVNVVSGIEEVKQAIATGRGVVVVSAHYANPEMVLHCATVFGIEIFALTEPLQPQRLNDLVHKLRAAHGLAFRPLSLVSLREALRWLRDGGVVPLLCDRDIQNTGMMLPFFGEETRVPTGAAELALRTGALIIPMFCRRTDGDRFDIFCEPPFEPASTGNHEEDVRTSTLKIVGAMERCLRKDPGQWIVLEPLWERDEERESTEDADAAPGRARR